MYVHVCRHAEAEQRSVTGRDIDRPLSREGRLQARYLASQFGQASHDELPRLVLASPAVRTMQTAQAIADELGLPVTPLEELLPCVEPRATIAALDMGAHGSPMVLVGHNPLVSSLVSMLLHGPRSGERMTSIHMRTGQMATIGFPDWMLPGTGQLVDMRRYEPALAS
ncbi:MAG: histidine phosphatase family protein [Phycisphaeraceae bacterium]|nr:histidine phosphatase family protein [Phycisphaeraceae bacterium]